MKGGPDRTAWGVGVAVVLIVASAAASQAGPPAGGLVGSVQFSEASLRGSSVLTTQDLNGAYISSQRLATEGGAVPLVEGHLAIEAPNVVVNWSYTRERQVGVSPNNQDESLVEINVEQRTGEDAFADASVALSYAGADVDILFLPEEQRLDHEAGTAGVVRALPAEGGFWDAGPAAPQSEAEKDPFLTVDHELIPGFPLLASSSGMNWSVKGDLVIYVWGPNVTVTPADGEPMTYRSGRWWSDRMGETVHPHGLTGQQHSQVLAVRVRNATLDLTHDVGPVQWTARTVAASTNGSVTFQKSRGLLKTPQSTYSVQDETFEIAGRLAQDLKPESGDDETLSSSLRGTATAISIPPSHRNVADGSGRTPGDQGSGDAGQPIPVAPLTGALGNWIPFGLLGVLLAGATWVVVDKRRSGAWGPSTLERAEMALARHDPAKARRYAKKVLRKNENDLDAWLLYGASLIKERSYAHAIKELEPAAERLDHDPGLAYVLTLAYAHMGEREGVRRWGEVVAQVPSLRRELRKDPAMAPYLDLEPLRPDEPGGDREVAYA